MFPAILWLDSSFSSPHAYICIYAYLLCLSVSNLYCFLVWFNSTQIEWTSMIEWLASDLKFNVSFSFYISSPSGLELSLRNVFLKWSKIANLFIFFFVEYISYEISPSNSSAIWNRRKNSNMNRKLNELICFEPIYFIHDIGSTSNIIFFFAFTMNEQFHFFACFSSFDKILKKYIEILTNISKERNHNNKHLQFYYCYCAFWLVNE